MPDEFVVTCPYCGESVDFFVEADVERSFVQDCQVCCNPRRLRVTGRDNERAVDVRRADGSVRARSTCAGAAKTDGRPTGRTTTL